jgi:hypothetical protein
MMLAATVGAGLSLDSAPSHSESWTVYRDSLYGCRLEYPSSLFSQEPLDLAENFQKFSGSNAQIFFRVMGVENKDKLSPAGVKARYLSADVPGDIVYERTKPDFLVLSGYRGGSIFYTKVAESPDQRTICILEITYPRKAKKAFDGVVTRMSRSFRTGN